MVGNELSKNLKKASIKNCFGWNLQVYFFIWLTMVESARKDLQNFSFWSLFYSCLFLSVINLFSQKSDKWNIRQVEPFFSIPWMFHLLSAYCIVIFRPCSLFNLLLMVLVVRFARWSKLNKMNVYNPTGNYMFKANNRNTRTRGEICPKLIIKAPETFYALIYSLDVLNQRKR